MFWFQVAQETQAIFLCCLPGLLGLPSFGIQVPLAFHGRILNRTHPRPKLPAAGAGEVSYFK